MAGKCVHHPGRDATTEIGGKKYCANCEDGQTKAAKGESICGQHALFLLLCC